jgi:hypothetical protein
MRRNLLMVLVGAAESLPLTMAAIVESGGVVRNETSTILAFRRRLARQEKEARRAFTDTLAVVETSGAIHRLGPPDRDFTDVRRPILHGYDNPEDPRTLKRVHMHNNSPLLIDARGQVVSRAPIEMRSASSTGAFSQRASQVEALWAGDELPGDSLVPSLLDLTGSCATKISNTSSLIEPPAFATHRLKVMGHQNTGTNLAQQLIQANLIRALTDAGLLDHWDSAGRDTHGLGFLTTCMMWLPPLIPADLGRGGKTTSNTTDVKAPPFCDDTWSGSGVHKHWPPKGQYFDALMAEPNTVVLALMRNPKSHVQSLRHRPYETQNKNCVSDDPPVCNLAFLADEPVTNQTFVNFAEEWNFMARSWHQAAKTANATVLLTSYEETVLQPEVVLARVFEAVGLKEYFDPECYKRINGARGPGESELGREQAIDHMREGLQSVPGDAELCKALDKDLLKLFPLPLKAGMTFADACPTNSGPDSFLQDDKEEAGGES